MEQYKHLPPSNSPLRVELPTKLVGVQAVPNMVAGDDGSLVNSGKVEVRFTSPPTKGSRKDVDWHKTAYLAGQEALYAYQYARDQDQRIEELERKYTNASMKYDAFQRDLTRLRPVINAAFDLRTWWGWFLLPKSFRRLISMVEQ